MVRLVHKSLTTQPGPVRFNVIRCCDLLCRGGFEPVVTQHLPALSRVSKIAYLLSSGHIPLLGPRVASGSPSWAMPRLGFKRLDTRVDQQPANHESPAMLESRERKKLLNELRSCTSRLMRVRNVRYSTHWTTRWGLRARGLTVPSAAAEPLTTYGSPSDFIATKRNLL